MMFAVMFFVDWRLGILLVILTIISIACMFGMYGDMTFMEKYAKALEKMNSEAVEYVRGMQVIKIFNASVASYKSFYNAISDYKDCVFKYTMSCRVPYNLFF
ncbi:ABC transporter ATP-binding protein [Treponema phagedenis]|nr:ABC transporter ATP-binding protein [Treponema phagedenis]QEJ99659.1 ABC transporter ATP-binding protein [Treponema phagedenis]QEK02217.1 ABC transporter ATP-binding protein [Treponema phagedenis]QEK05210.1 ABC transporter ATP-binding protein [Treponema phagedenis]QEK07807.1 ABC transporter ATP-binding protein [Treponema phagedenis]